MRFKPTQLWWVLVPVLAASALYWVKFEVRTLRDEIAAMQRDLAREHATLQVLDAEWSYLNRPQRLQELADAHLKTLFATPVQLASVGDLPRVYALAAGVFPGQAEVDRVALASAESVARPVSATRGAYAPYAQLQGSVTVSSLRLGGHE